MKRKSIATGNEDKGGETMTRMATLMLGLAAVVAALAMTTPARAATGVVGHVAGSEATCLSGQIGVTSPTIAPSVAANFGNDGSLVVGGYQWVAYRAHLVAWDGYRWVIDASGPWLWQRAGGVTFGTWDFYNSATGQWGDGSTYFNINRSGYYKVTAEYYWHPTSIVGSGYDYAWATGQFDHRVGGGAVDWCQY